MILNGLSKRNILLQHRDYLILKWTLEMKFSDSTIIHRVFFGKDNSVARRRLNLLVRNGFLKEKLILERAKFYIISSLGFHMIKSYFSLPQNYPPKPYLPLYTMRHDQKVIECRVKLEELHLAQDWVSDRALQSESFKKRVLENRDYIPDGLFKGADSNIWAFELESSLKNKLRIKEKINNYRFRMAKGDGKFTKCLFVCSKTAITTAIRNSVGMPGDFFRVIDFEELFRDGFSLSSVPPFEVANGDDAACL